jgi:hypothetical protein
VRFAAAFAAKSQALAGPAKDPGQHTAQEMAVVSEVACALTVRGVSDCLCRRAVVAG